MGDLASEEPDLLLEVEMRLCFITILLACVVAQGAIHSYEESTEVVEDKSEVDELLQEDAEKGHKNCPQREEEATKLLKAYQAARLLHRQSPRYGVQDETTTQLLTAWGALYKSARAKYVFYCTQTEQDLDDIANAVKKKEVVAVENAAQAGLMAAQAAMKQKRAAAEKAHKSVVRRAYAEKKEKRTGEDRENGPDCHREEYRALEEIAFHHAPSVWQGSGCQHWQGHCWGPGEGRLPVQNN